MASVSKILSVALLVFVIGCGGSKETSQPQPQPQQPPQQQQPKSDVQQQINNIPDFFLNPPQDNEEFLYGTGTGVSSRQMTAIQKGENAARQSITQKLGETMDALQKSFTEEITSGGDSNTAEAFSNVNKILASQELKGVTTVERQLIPANNNTQFRSYILLKMPIGQAKAALENALSQEEELYVKFKESKAFQELEKELAKSKEDN